MWETLVPLTINLMFGLDTLSQDSEVHLVGSGRDGDEELLIKCKK